ncbi:type II toxin-antitoxin system death-on-curing family toxin [Patescibacteria group bacterium]|nr:type II toxin-antitoxin system death-on-curing family toxin [Patescibacteria group bacterium]
MVYYLSEDHLNLIFELLSKRYARVEEVPHYKLETTGFDSLCGVLKRVQADTYYPLLFEKAVYLLININKGHFFSNGNKRLALVTMTTFLDINQYKLKKESKDWYREFLTKLFPEYKQWQDFEDFRSTDFATYNLSIMIADSGVYNISHDELKERVLSFLKNATEPL